MRHLPLTRRSRRSRRAALLAVPLSLAVAASTVAAFAPSALGATTAGASGRATAAAAAHHAPAVSWRPSATGTTSRFRGLAAVSRKVAWVAGSDATVLRTTNGGKSWKNVSPPAAQTQATDGLLLFRDVEAWDAKHAVVLAIGEGTDSRILVTRNGGRTWKTTFTNSDAAAFYDCMGFFDAKHGLAVSDPVDGKFRILSTSTGGRHWKVLPTKGMPAALDGEFGFAASGTCLVTSSRHDAWIASGGAAFGRVFHTTDRGRHWTVRNTPIPGSASAGIFSLAFRGNHHAVAVGGDYLAPDAAVDNAATTRDGRHWKIAKSFPGGYRSGAAWVPWTRATVLAVGPTGSDVSRNGGRTWTAFDTASYDVVQCARDGACWASGDLGAVATLHRT